MTFDFICFLAFFARQRRYLPSPFKHWLAALRIPLLLISQFGMNVSFRVTGTLPKMKACSILWKDGVAIEGLFIVLSIPCLFPMIAGLPVSMSLGIQLANALIFGSVRYEFCAAMSGTEICPATPEQYAGIHGLLAVLFSLPFAIKEAEEPSFYRHCGNGLLFAMVGLLQSTSLLYRPEYPTRSF
jgi:hypothetical protein